VSLSFNQVQTPLYFAHTHGPLSSFHPETIRGQTCSLPYRYAKLECQRMLRQCIASSSFPRIIRTKANVPSFSGKLFGQSRVAGSISSKHHWLQGVGSSWRQYWARVKAEQDVSVGGLLVVGRLGLRRMGIGIPCILLSTWPYGNMWASSEFVEISLPNKQHKDICLAENTPSVVKSRSPYTIQKWGSVAGLGIGTEKTVSVRP